MFCCSDTFYCLYSCVLHVHHGENTHDGLQDLLSYIVSHLIKLSHSVIPDFECTLWLTNSTKEGLHKGRKSHIAITFTLLLPPICWIIC